MSVQSARVCCLLAASLGLLAGGCAKRTDAPVHEQPKTATGEPQALAMTISLPKSKWQAGETLSIDVTITNAGESTLYIDTVQPSLGFQGTLVDQAGKEYGVLITRIEGSFGLVHRDFFREVPGNGTFELTLTPTNIHDFATPQSHAWLKLLKGNFRLQLSYSSDSAKYWDRQRDAYVELPGAWTGKVISNEFEFEVE